MADINAKYQVWNGNEWDKINFETIPEQILGLANAVQSHRLTTNNGLPLATVYDMNTAIETGNYLIGDNTNDFPTGKVIYGVLKVDRRSSAAIFQEITGYDTAWSIQIWKRFSRTGGTDWSPWNRVSANSEDANYINATLQNGWAGWLQYKRIANGGIRLLGEITKGTITNGTTIAVLPAEYRPPITTPIPTALRSLSQGNIGLYLTKGGILTLTKEAADMLSVATGLLINYIYFVG